MPDINVSVNRMMNNHPEFCYNIFKAIIDGLSKIPPEYTELTSVIHNIRKIVSLPIHQKTIWSNYKNNPWYKVEVAIKTLYKNFNSWTLPEEFVEMIENSSVSFKTVRMILKTLNDYPNILDRDNPYIYFFTRQDLSPEQMVVQTSHVAFCMGVHFGHNEYNSGFLNPYQVSFVVLGVANEEALMKAFKYSETKFAGPLTFVEPAKSLTTFNEPDMNNEMTSFCTPVIRSYATRNLFRNFNLLKIKTISINIGSLFHE